MKITDLAKRDRYDVGEGWYPLVKKLCKDIAKIDPKIDVSCIKEKFGGLRFYVTSGNDKVYNLIEKACQESFKICEMCGTREGVALRKGGWVLTLCEDCKKVRK